MGLSPDVRQPPRSRSDPVENDRDEELASIMEFVDYDESEGPKSKRRGRPSGNVTGNFNADEAIGGWAREEATGNLCLGTRAVVRERVGSFLAGLARRKEEVRRRCRTVLQSRAEALQPASLPDSLHPANAHPTLALV